MIKIDNITLAFGQNAPIDILTPAEPVVQKLSPWLLGLFFVCYIAGHVAIGMYLQGLKKQLEQDKENKDLQQQVKTWQIIFKWFPALAVIGIILLLLML